VFDLIEDRKRPEIKWWTIPGAVFIIFCTGMDTGILIGRRNVDPFEWLQVVFLICISLGILWPIAREVMVRGTEERKKDEAP